MRIQLYPERRRRLGSAVIVVLVIIAIVMIYVAGNVRTLSIIGREVKLVESRQVRHWSVVKVRREAPLPEKPAPGR